MGVKKYDRQTTVIAIDFDGVLCTDEYPEIGEPNMEVIQEAKSLREGGACLILWTCRAGEDLDKAVQACREWGLEFDAINENPQFMIDLYGNDCRKIGADEYWDDRAVFMQAPRKGQGNWRILHGCTVCPPLDQKRMRSFIAEVLRPAIVNLTGMGMGAAEVLKQTQEIIEQLLAERDALEQNSIHGWYRRGYKDATQNAASWITDFMEQTGVLSQADETEDTPQKPPDTTEGGDAL